MEFEDQDWFLVRFLLPLAIVAYLLVLLLRSGSVLQWTIAAIVALLSYFMLNKGWPNTYPTMGTTMLLTVVGLLSAMLFLVYAAAWIMVIVAMLSLAVPTLQHNADLIANWLGAPQWVGLVLLGAGILLLLLMIYLSRIFPLVGLLLKVVFTSLFLQIMLRQLYLEHPPDMDRLDMACFSSSSDPPGRCALAFDSYTWIGALVLLVVVQCYALYAFRCKRKKKYEQVGQATQTQTEGADADDDEEEVELF
jgi:hypothetical protein